MLMIPTLDQFLQAVSNAISLGSMYALIAIGYTMVYGILRLINFAHGDMLMVAMYFAFYCVTLFMLPWYIALLLAIIGVTLLGAGIEKVAYKPMRSAPRVSLLISAIGMSYLLENLAVVIFGGIPKNFPEVPLFQDHRLCRNPAADHYRTDHNGLAGGHLAARYQSHQAWHEYARCQR